MVVVIESVTIVEQPHHLVLEHGPRVGEGQEVTLTCEADGWPLPTYQWKKHGADIPGANGPTLKIDLRCYEADALKTYRCIKCKKASKIPVNVFDIMCVSCQTTFRYKDVSADLELEYPFA